MIWLVCLECQRVLRTFLTEMLFDRDDAQLVHLGSNRDVLTVTWHGLEMGGELQAQDPA